VVLNAKWQYTARMELFPIPTGLLQAGDDLAAAITQNMQLHTNDIIVVSSKAIATVENAFIDLASLTPSKKARDWSEKTGRSAAFCQAVLDETKRLHGKVLGACPGALLTEVTPEGLPEGSILIANAGLDESNVPEGKALGWPKDPVESIATLRRSLESMSGAEPLAVILTDSNCQPRRHGVSAFAMAVSGINPIKSEKGTADLFGKPLKITDEAVADQLATASNFLMGNAAQGIPAVVIRNNKLPFSTFEGWVPAIHESVDLFSALI
jgi:coenzyme F420-0:L-glutamate ligase / coenzyme F420-1:gamma-L-glutamate ligase